VPNNFQYVRDAQAPSTEHDPADEPEEIKGEAKHHRVNAVPERNREAHRREWNEGDR
jgi:hypothetical protein